MVDYHDSFLQGKEVETTKQSARKKEEKTYMPKPEEQEGTPAQH
jgi:hypothetical protein